MQRTAPAGTKRTSNREDEHERAPSHGVPHISVRNRCELHRASVEKGGGSEGQPSQQRYRMRGFTLGGGVDHPTGQCRSDADRRSQQSNTSTPDRLVSTDHIIVPDRAGEHLERWKLKTLVLDTGVCVKLPLRCLFRLG